MELSKKQLGMQFSILGDSKKLGIVYKEIQVTVIYEILEGGWLACTRAKITSHAGFSIT